MSGLTIDFETADRITVLSLKDQLSYLREEVRLHVEEGQYMHPEDYHMSMTKLIPALELLIPYYGGTL
jgi:hypothetical protein